MYLRDELVDIAAFGSVVAFQICGVLNIFPGLLCLTRVSGISNCDEDFVFGRLFDTLARLYYDVSNESGQHCESRRK